MILPRPVRTLLASLAFLVPALLSLPAAAQIDQSIPENAVREPWELHALALTMLSGESKTSNAGTVPAAAASALAGSDAALAAFEREIDAMIDGLAGDPQYPYVAGEKSAEMAATLAEVQARLDDLYRALGASERPAVVAAQAALGTLQSMLQKKYLFERDVENALGSGSRQQITALARRWWSGSERVAVLRTVLAELRASSGTR